MGTKDQVTVDSLREWLVNNKAVFKETDSHFQVNCFLCTDTRNRLGISKIANTKKKMDVGGWHCFNCNSSGRKLNTLEYAVVQKKGLKFKTKEVIKKEDPDGDFEKKSKIEPELHKKLKKVLEKEDCDVYRYLTEDRKISPKAIDYFQVGARRVFLDKYDRKKNYGDHVALPYLINDTCVNVKYRSLNPEAKKEFKWRREKGGLTILFNDNALDNFDYEEIIIAESEIDAMSIWSLGFENVIGLTAGANSFKQAWYERLLRFKKVYLVLDNDTAGQEGAEAVAKRIGLDRCYNIVLPEEFKDPNDFLVKDGDPETFRGFLQKGTQFEIASVKSLRDIMKKTFKSRFREGVKIEAGIELPYKSLAEKTGLMKAGHLVVIAARPKVGKTSFSLDLVRRLSLGKKKIACGFYSCEMSLESLADKFIVQVVPDIESIDDISEDHYLYGMHLLKKSKIQMCRPEAVDDLQPEKIVEKITDIVKRYGVKLFVFDNLHFACRSEDEYTAIGKLTQALKICAEQLGITIVAITHPRKGAKRTTTDDLKGSSSIFQDADLVIILNREVVDEDDLTEEEKGIFNGAMSPLVDFDVTGRWSAGGRTHMFFNESRTLFSDHGADFDRVMELKKEKSSKK